MNYQVKDFSYSTKNIPLASKSKYLQTLIEKTESLIHRMRWKAFFFLQNHDSNSNDKETYGFKSKRPPPHVSALDEFEDNIVRITDIDGHIEYITFAKEYGSKKGQTHPTWRRVVCNYEQFKNDIKDGAYFCYCAHVLRITQAMVKARARWG